VTDPKSLRDAMKNSRDAYAVTIVRAIELLRARSMAAVLVAYQKTTARSA
jgi:hypothetical protein